MSWNRLVFPAVVALLACSPAISQSTDQEHLDTLDAPIGTDYDFTLDSGDHSNGTFRFDRVFGYDFEDKDVAWIRVYFGECSLPSGSYIRLTAGEDGAEIDMDAAQLAQWNNTSPYFNGGTLYIDLFAAPGATGVSMEVDHLAVQDLRLPPSGGCGICGTDDRIRSDLDWSGRILSVGCTGSIYNHDSCVVSAGHCVFNGTVIQFRVPRSNSDCSLNHPPPEDQFPITDVRSRNNGIGLDWAVMSTGTNNIGETAYERYGAMMPIATSVAGVGDDANVWGFGIDSFCRRNQVQQDSLGGPIFDVLPTYYDFTVDMTYGNSGSGLIVDGAIVGIVTHCRGNCPNIATRVDNLDFADARDSFCPFDDCPGSCQLPDNYGQGTAGANGVVPLIGDDERLGCSFLGNQSFVLQADGFLGGTAGFLLIGFNPVDIDGGGWRLLVEPWASPRGFVLPMFYDGAGSGSGSAVFPAPIPDNPQADGLDIYCQFMAFDSQAAGGISATDGLHARLCQ